MHRSVFEVREEDGMQVSKRLGLDEDYLNKLISALTGVYGEYEEPDPEETIEPSFMLSFYNVDQDSLYGHLVYLGSVFWVTQVVIYITLVIQTRVSRL